MEASIKKFRLEDEYYFKEGCHIVEVSNSASDEQLSVARARVEVNKTTAWHQLKDTTERYIVLEGSGLVEIGNLPATLITTGDVVIIPEQTPQRIRNTGPTDLVFLAICTPRFNPENYQALENHDGNP